MPIVCICIGACLYTSAYFGDQARLIWLFQSGGRCYHKNCWDVVCVLGSHCVFWFDFGLPCSLLAGRGCPMCLLILPHLFHVGYITADCQSPLLELAHVGVMLHSSPVPWLSFSCNQLGTFCGDLDLVLFDIGTPLDFGNQFLCPYCPPIFLSSVFSTLVAASLASLDDSLAVRGFPLTSPLESVSLNTLLFHFSCGCSFVSYALA